MNKKTIIVTLSFLITGLIIGIGIAYYFSLDTSKGQSLADSSKGKSVNLTSGKRITNRNKMYSLFDCPCGGCSDKLFDCKCTTAKEVTGYLNSLIGKDISEGEIKDKMVEKYGISVIGDHSSVPPYYENIEGIQIPVTMDPKFVSEEAWEAYDIAKEYPELLMQMPCYCGCDKGKATRRPHRSLLDCFTNRHAENCRICMDDAMIAKDKMEQGIQPEEIRRAIIEKRGRMRS